MLVNVQNDKRSYQCRISPRETMAQLVSLYL